MKYLLLFIVCLCFQFSNAQPDSLFIKEKEQKYTGPQWSQKNKGTVDISQVSFTNWNAGGSNSISGLAAIFSSLNYKDKFFNWKNNVNLSYGINRQQGRETRKTDDIFEINSNLGFKPDSLSNWFFSARVNFRTQLTNGFNYPNVSEPISKFLAPGYLFLGAGMEYGKNIDQLSFYFSPLTLKTTFVLDEDLANAGSYGVNPAVLDINGDIIIPGDKIRTEFGVLITNSYQMEVIENINLRNEVSIYSDYINNFGNLDLDWRIDFDFKVNSFVRATFGSHLRYDDDVKTQTQSDIEGEFDEAGAKVQWKQFLGVGFAVDF
ncbi:MAG: DUF3078 domain-containing protein [Algibacter sp.]|uniref:DUF3078 domain-containing protein n=1 Tax=Algibacter sp. TaxID=1872428 RepID=UPI0026396216|nr:DUF3078 domain-containing protein [Algibacter sp.]MDG1728535.1 DUF3078 domain-containing protein [Algibacter sp.]MDG2179307.1 DUF3078 domain-containing protein [Algibacter sp.]